MWLHSPRRAGVACSLLAGMGVLCCVGGQSAVSQVTESVIRIEEDWRIVLNEPDGNVDSPQFHTVMAPGLSFESYFAQVLWNYREAPEFTPGGVQLQSYQGETVTRARSIEFAKLNTLAEAITWTQSLTTDGVILTFAVENGVSSSWGTFGRDMRLSSNAYLPNLSGYQPDFSAENSGVTYGSNRVDLMVITQVRYYGPSGLLATDSTPRVVFELDQ